MPGESAPPFLPLQIKRSFKRTVESCEHRRRAPQKCPRETRTRAPHPTLRRGLPCAFWKSSAQPLHAPYQPPVWVVRWMKVLEWDVGLIPEWDKGTDEFKPGSPGHYPLIYPISIRAGIRTSPTFSSGHQGEA